MDVRTILGTALVSLGAAAATAQSDANLKALPDGPGKETFGSVCNLCHDGPTAVVGKQWTKAQWDAKVTEMLQEEPDVTTAERAAIVDYLSANFKPGGKIYVNLAKPKDLAAALELTADAGEALVRYRETNGKFKAIEDLKNAAGVNAGKIDAKKDRLEF